MPSSQNAPAVATQTKPSTRASLRHTLNLHSVSRALADVIHKDSKDSGSDKGAEKEKAKRSKDRRMSAIPAPPPVASRTPPLTRASMGERPPSVSSVAAPSLRDTPEKVAAPPRRSTRARKLATASSEESASVRTVDSATSASISAAQGEPRRMTLRPRTHASGASAGTPTGSANGATALPKYRAKTPAVEALKSEGQVHSPARPAHRRKASNSEDDDSEETRSNMSGDTKGSRAISPLPKRAALVPTTNNATPIAAAHAKMPPAKTARNESPTLRPPTKALKRAGTISTETGHAAAAGAIPRPSSAQSVRSLSGVRRTEAPVAATPKSTSRSIRNVFGLARPNPPPSAPATPSMVRFPSQDESPLGPRSVNGRHASISPQSDKSATPTGKVLHEGDSIDSVHDVEMLLGTVASPTGATPAMGSKRPSKRREYPETPSHAPRRQSSQQSQARSLGPQLSPIEDSPNHLRPQATRTLPHDVMSVSWDQLAEGARGSMLLEVPTPFTGNTAASSAAISRAPTGSSLVPESPGPNFAMLRSPGGALSGSISGMLLPDLTPSPAPINKRELFGGPPPGGLLLEDGAVPMLRLQVAAAENTAKERLATIQSLEEQLHAAKEARQRDMQELAQHVNSLEGQLRSSLETRGRINDERNAYTAALEQQLQQAEAARGRAVEEAVAGARRAAHAAQVGALQAQQRRWQTACSAKDAAGCWASVRDVAEAELELVRAGRETLALLLAGLDQQLARLA